MRGSKSTLLFTLVTACYRNWMIKRQFVNSIAAKSVGTRLISLNVKRHSLMNYFVNSLSWHSHVFHESMIQDNEINQFQDVFKLITLIL